MFDDLDLPAKKKAFEIGLPLDDFSVDELQETVEILKEEIIRLEQSMQTKKASAAAADQFFK